MPTQAELIGLRDRVLAAKGADRDLNEAIHAALFPNEPWWRAMQRGRELVAAGKSSEVIDACNCRLRADSWATSSNVADYSGSLDAAAALAEKALPPSKSFAPGSPPSSGWKFTFYRGMTPTNDPHGYWQVNLRQHASNGYDGDGRTLALAILAALLTALASREAPNVG